MRAGPLSNSKVISLLNTCFVPVYTVNEDYSEKGAAPAEEKAERNRIFKEGYAAKLSVGTVHVYLLAPEGHLKDSMHVAEAARPENLIARLEKVVADLKVQPGKPLIAPAPQSCAPERNGDALVLHLTARSLDGRGAWSEFPPENWIVLERNEWRELLPPAKVGSTRKIEAGVATKLLTHFYPATENNDVSKNKFEHQQLKVTVVSLNKGIARARIEGNFRMQHSFYHKEDGKVVEATVIGYLNYDARKPRVRSLLLTTDKATYGGGTFGIALRSVGSP